MHIKTRNVNTAFRTLVGGIFNGEIPTVSEDSRNGKVLRVDEPVLITYDKPTERVLFNRVRDANPFFHLYEALYMLSGGNKIAPLAYYAKQMAEYSDDGITQNGAYGYRWRNANPARSQVVSYSNDLERSVVYEVGDSIGTDQLNILVSHLKSNPTSRRAVLQMWNVEDDLLKIGGEKLFSSKSPFHSTGSFEQDKVTIDPGSKDVCCNLSVMLSLRKTHPFLDAEYIETVGSVATMRKPKEYALDMTVTNRSNDLVWGCLGANYVHFSILQEYMAARIGVEVGKYHHFTNNLHCYVERKDWNPVGWLEYEAQNYKQDDWNPHRIALVNDPIAFDDEVASFVELNKENGLVKTTARYQEPFLDGVAQPMCHAFHAHKNRNYGNSLNWSSRIKDEAWRYVATNWINKRKLNWEAKNGD